MSISPENQQIIDNAVAAYAACAQSGQSVLCFAPCTSADTPVWQALKEVGVFGSLVAPTPLNPNGFCNPIAILAESWVPTETNTLETLQTNLTSALNAYFSE